MAIPTVGSQLLGLAPRVKVRVGAILVAGGALVGARLHEYGLIAGVPIMLAAFGVAGIVVGARELRARRAMDFEIAVALDRREELARALAKIVADGGNVARYLQSQGFRDYAVRRWIAAEFGPSAQSQSENRSGSEFLVGGGGEPSPTPAATRGLPHLGA